MEPKPLFFGHSAILDIFVMSDRPRRTTANIDFWLSWSGKDAAIFEFSTPFRVSTTIKQSARQLSISQLVWASWKDLQYLAVVYR
jgi:hypothetical protein